MKNKKISVTVVIPAYNEEKNIFLAINSILEQNQKNYILERLLIISDGSSDNTVSEVLKIKSKKITLVNNSKRLGKIKRLNYAFKCNTSDVLVQFDADIILKGKTTIEKLIVPFKKNKKIDIVYGNPIPKKPKTFIGQLAYFDFYSWDIAKKMVHAERYNCYGCITAFSKAFLERYRLPEDRNYAEDTYGFYYAKQHGNSIYFQKSARVYFKLPATFSDYIKQMNRYLTTENGLNSIFEKKLMDKYETITHLIKFKAFIKNSFKNNINTVIGYFILQVSANIYTIFHKQNNLWGISKSSK